MTRHVRPAAVAGVFYPGSQRALKGDVDEMLRQARRARLRSPKAIIAPHAGYIYSGPVAASVYAPLADLRGKVKRVVLLGPTHRVPIDGLAVPSSEAFATPLGNVPIDRQAIASIEDMAQIVVSDEAHAL